MSWEPKGLDELGFVGRGRSRHRPRDAAHLYGGPHPFVQTGDVKHARLYLTEYTQTYSEDGLAQSRMWPAGTLCITIAANIADTAILGFDACFPDSVIGFIPVEKKADARFIKYLFDALLQRKYKQFTQGAAQDNLSQAKLLSLKFPIPGITEQKQIADVISAYDDLIENNRRRIQLLEQAARLFYKEWFVHLRFPGHEHTRIIDGVPDGWKVGTIGDLGEVITGKTPSKKKPENFGSDLPFIKTPDMHGNAIVVHTEESLSEEGAKTQANKTLPPRSILVSCIGTVGAVAFNASPAQTNQQINSIVPASDLVTYWAYFMAKELKPLLEGMGGGATMANVNKSKFSGIKVVIPSKQLLNLFSDFAKPVFDQIENLTISNALLAKARDLLLPKLMNGEVAM
jgi:type I restriction enzyme S subunit